MSSKGKATCVAAVLVLAVFWVIHYGCFGYRFIRVSYFEGATSQDTGVGARVNMGVTPKIQRGILPGSKAPFDLGIGFYTDTADTLVRTVVVQKVIIQYKNGRRVTAISPIQPRVMPFESRRTSNWDGMGIVYNDSLAVAGRLTNAVAEHESFTVECEGMLVDEAGKQLPFSTFWTFHPKRTMGILPSYYLDLGVGSSDMPKP